jgi:hypothetical protein
MNRTIRDGLVVLRDARLLALSVLWGVAVCACGHKLAQGYRVSFYDLPEEPETLPAVLYSGWRNGSCQEDLVYTGRPDVFMGTLNPAEPWHHCNKEELVAFSRGHAPNISWVNRSLEELSVPLQPPVPVDITLWIVEQVASEEEAQFDADDARGVYDDFGTGIDVVFHIKRFPHSRYQEMDGNPATEGELDEWAECKLASALSGMRPRENDRNYQSGFDPGRLNVYYVAGINPSSGAASGINCGYPPYLRNDVMFVDGLYESSPATLAHELGHAFGQRRGGTRPGGKGDQYGHVDELVLDGYLTEYNIMKSDVTLVEQITLGQIYRMHYDELTWLWEGHARAGEYPRTCQSNPVAGGPCPPLTLEPPGEWP